MSGTISNNISQSSGSITAPAGGVSIVSSDPTLTNGLVWYNSTSNVLKVARNIAAWASGEDYPSTHTEIEATGVVSAIIACAGTSGATLQKTSYEYNGSAWASNVNMNTASSGPSRGGTQTSALIAGGTSSYSGSGARTARSESYNGTAWTNEADYGGGTRYGMGGCGAAETAIVVTAGKTAGGHNYTNATYEYNGASWASAGNSNFSGEARHGTGVQTAALYAGGTNAGGYTVTSEEYNGASHTAGNSMATARGYHGAAGTMTDALMFDGDHVSTEIYNGTSYSAGTANDGRLGAGSHGASSTSAYCVAGQGPSWGTLSPTMKIYSEGMTARTLSNS